MIGFPPPFSRSHHAVLVVGLVCLLTCFAGIVLVGARNDGEAPTPTTNALTRARIAESFGKLPLSFEINKGQVEQPVKFVSRGRGYILFLTPAEAVLTLEKPRKESEAREGSVLRLKMIGANAAPAVEGQDELLGKVNYFVGNNPDKWRREIPTYRKVHYKDIYPGVDMVYYGNQGELEYDFVVAPGANPRVIKFRVEGTERIRLDDTGNLLLALNDGEVRLHKPVIYQLTAEGERRDVKGAYVVNRNEISFKVRAFDAKKPLVIDPVLSYSTFLGAGSNEHALGIAVDSQGSAYVTGVTNSSDFPTTAGAFQTTGGFGGAAFVSKLDATGSNLVYSTYLSGSNFGNTTGTAIAVDAAGNAHVVGRTQQSDFPTVNALKTTGNFFKSTDSAANWNNNNTGLPTNPGGVDKIAVAPNAPNTIYVTAFGGPHRSTDGGATWIKTGNTGLPQFSFAGSLAVDPNNSQVVYGGFGGFDGGLFKTTDGGDNWSAVTTIPLNGSNASMIVFDPATPSTMYVGAGAGVFKSTDGGATWTTLNNGLPNSPSISALAIDPATPSTMYVGTVSNGLFKTTNGGGNWTAMNNGMGGSSPNSIRTIVIDPLNPSTIYTSHNFSGGFNKSTNGGDSWTPINNGVPANVEIFGMVADRTSANTVYAGTSGAGVIKTTNGGTSWTRANAGLWSYNVRNLVGHPTDSAILFVGTNADQNFQDVFVTKLNASGSGLLFSSLLGGTFFEFGNGIALDGNGNIHVVGQTSSDNFPAVNAIQSTLSPTDTCNNAFVTKINPAVPSYVFSTYLGGTKCDGANAVATDPSGNVYVTGNTSSSDFPLANAFQGTLGESFNGDAFVTKLTSAGALSYSTFLGGNSDDIGHGIAADISGNAYVTGATRSSNFPTANPIQPTSACCQGDVFVTKLNPQGSALVYSTYLGGSGGEVGRGITVDSTGNAFVTGFTSSLEFPLVPGALHTRSVLFKSGDGGANWSNDNYGIKASSISSIVVHPTQPATIYAGTNAGVFKSTNGGRTWSAINNGLNSKTVIALVIDPTTPSTIYAATSELFSNDDGVYKSTDGGNSWNLRKTGMNNTSLLSLAIDPVTPATLYAGVSGNPVVYKSTDGADNWAPAGNALPFFFPISLAVNPHTPSTLFAAESSSAGGVFRSIDSGSTWQSVGLATTGAHGLFVGVSPHTADLVYAVTNGGGIFKSVDGGTNWSSVRSGFGRIVFDPVSSTTLYFTSGFEGVLKSTDSGQTWVLMNNGLDKPEAGALAIDPLKTSTLYVASSASLLSDDAFVTKINPAGSALIYSTLIGGTRQPGDPSGISAQAFAIAIDSAGNAYITGLARGLPTTPNAFQPSNRGFEDAFVSKLTMSFIISGHVLEGGSTPLSGAEVVLNDGGVLTTFFTESDGSYEFSRLREGGSFTVTATKPHFTMAPPSQSFNNLNNDQVLNFTATATNAPFFTISGQVIDNGAGLAGVTVALSGSQLGTRTTDSNGNYSFELLGDGNYTVTASLTGFTFTPPSQTFNNLSANQMANFTSNRQNLVVTNTNNHGAGSLREAIITANATVGLDTIVFNIPGSGVHTINPQTALPEITDPVVIDGTTQPGYAGSPLVTLDGTGLDILSNATGLFIKGGSSTVRGLAIVRFNSGGIGLSTAGNNLIQGNYIGVDATGTIAQANSTGIFISNSSNNTIGGTTAAARNVISGNTSNGIGLGGSNNIVQGNFIGTNAAGTAAIPNSTGIDIISSQFTNNLIGGTAAGAGNLISGNQRSISIVSPGNTIQGNLIGTDVTGTKKIPNSSGMDVRGANNLIGGLTPSARNIISGNSADGVVISGTGSKLQGNYIGTDITGTLALGNGGTGVVCGDNVVIGGTVPEARNIISGNGATFGLGNLSIGSNTPGSGVTVQGNYIGTDVTGTRALLTTSRAGITLASANNKIGGLTAAERNVISGNRVGIQISSVSQPGNVIQGNLIGLNALGTGQLANTDAGIAIAAASNNIIGGTQAGAGNTIAFNGGPGIVVFFGTRNSIRGNAIFSNNGLGIDLSTNSSQNPNGVTPNDLNDPDTGANNLQNFPLLTSVMAVGGNTTIQGSLNSTPNTTFEIDFYSSAALDPSGNGEGAQFFNSTSVTTDGNGNAAINASFPVALGTGRVVTATATDSNGNTSEFSTGDASGATGSVQFSVSSIQVIEDLGILNVTVLRTGGSTGNLSVEFATADGTAIAGQDYTATSGTLNFSGGETSKTFTIPILDDATTEPDETFTIALRNASTIDSLGSPSVLTVILQDRSTVPTLGILDAGVVEGSPGTTTDALFLLNLSAATGRTVSVNIATSNLTTFGGTSCGTRGVDYETKSTTITFQPGTTLINVPIRVCGDTGAEANEFFEVILSNPSNATIIQAGAIGTILNDDVLQLALEESGPTATEAAALDALLLRRDPFSIVGVPDWWPNAPDKNTRVVLFAKNLELAPNQPASAVVVRIAGLNTQFFDVPAESVLPIHNFEFTQVVIRLPETIPVGTRLVTIRVNGRISNAGTIRIQ